MCILLISKKKIAAEDTTPIPSRRGKKRLTIERRSRVGFNVTLNFHTLDLCDSTGNRSRAIDEAVRMIEKLGLVEQSHERVTNEP